MKIIVTGGLGFIGSHIVDSYVSKGHDVIVLDNLFSGSIKNLNNKARLVQMSLLDKDLKAFLLDEKPDIINHQAAQVNVRESVENPLTDLDINLVGTVRLLEAAGASQVKKVLFASSGGTVYGNIMDNHKPFTEDLIGIPISPYGINKLTSEFYIQFYASKFGFNWAALRYSNVYGPRQNPHGESGVISIFIERLSKGQPPIVYGNGEQVRDYVYVSDVVTANILLSKIDIPNGAYNVGTGRGTTLNQLISILAHHFSKAKTPVYKDEKFGDLRWNILSVHKLMKLGWKPKVNISEGLKILAELKGETL